MTDSPDYRMYLQKCFESIDQKLDTIVSQTTRTNSRVTKLEDISHDRQIVIEDFRHLEKDYEGMKKNVSDIKTDIEELRIFKKHPTWGLILISVFVIGMVLNECTKSQLSALFGTVDIFAIDLPIPFNKNLPIFASALNIRCVLIFNKTSAGLPLL